LQAQQLFGLFAGGDVFDGEQDGCRIALDHPARRQQQRPPTGPREVACHLEIVKPEDGSRFWARVMITTLRDDVGQPRGFAKVTRDITKSMGAQTRFSQVVESALNALVMVNPEGKIMLVNAQTERLFGYSRDELLGQPVELLVPERFRGNHPAFRNDFFARPQVRPMGVGRDLYGQRKDGSEFPVEIGLNPIKSDEGLVVLAAIVDITERK
jgi:PAS domain S-box-containing protein